MSETTFKVVSDSCCDIPEKWVREHDVDIVPLYVAFSDGVYRRDFYDFTYHEFYQQMLDRPGDFPKTSLPSVEDYMKAWEPYVAKGIPVLSLSMTSRMSGSYNSARTAREAVLEEHPEARIEVIDSTALTILEGMYVCEACRLRDLGKSLEEAAEILRGMQGSGRAYFTIGDMSYLAKGGRIGGLIRFAAGGLGLKPVILFKDGLISLCKITRSRQRSLKELAKQAAAFFIEQKADPADYYLDVGYGLSETDGKELFQLFLDALQGAGINASPRLVQIGTMVGAHNGPMLMGIAFLKKHQFA